MSAVLPVVSGGVGWGEIECNDDGRLRWSLSDGTIVLEAMLDDLAMMLASRGMVDVPGPTLPMPSGVRATSPPGAG